MMVRGDAPRRGGASGTFERRLAVDGSAELADDTHYFALDLDLAGEDRFHLAVRGLQADPFLLTEEPLKGYSVVLEQGHDDIPVTGGCRGLDDHVVAVVDERVDHALTTHPQNIRPVSGLYGARHVERLRGVRVRLDGLTGGDLAQDR